MGISPQERPVTRWAQALTSTVYKPGITARPKDGAPEVARRRCSSDREASWLTADVLLDDGFSLMLGVATPKVAI